MSGKLNYYFTEMDRLLALDSKYRRPGYTMDMNDFAYLYILAAYSLLMLRELGVRLDTRLELPLLMTDKASPRYLYDLAYCYYGEEEEEEYGAYDYYARQWAEMYEPYTGCLSKKNAHYELSDFMYRYFLDIRENNGFGLWTLFSEEDCMELCSTEHFSDAGIPDKDTLSRAVTFFMYSRGDTGSLPSMGIEFSKETENEVSFIVDNTLFICGVFALTSAKTEKIAAALENRDIHDERARSFLEKCSGPDRLLWRPGKSILADYTNNYETVARTQIIGVDNDCETSFDYADISPLLPVYLYYLEKAAEAMDSIYFDGKVLGEDTDGKQKRED